MLRRLLISLAVCTLALAGCTAPDNPVTPGGKSTGENNREDSNVPVEELKDVSVHYEVSVYMPITSWNATFPGDVKMRHTLRFYRANGSGGWMSTPEVEKVAICDIKASDPQRFDVVDVTLKTAVYRVLIWSDFVKSDVNWFWNPDNFSMVGFQNPYQGSSVYKVCCFGDESHDFSKAIAYSARTIGSSSCVSGFRIVATDAASFEGKDLTAVISYQDPIPTALNLFDGSVSAVSYGIDFSSPVEKLEDGTVSIAYDYILMATDEASYKATLTLQEKDGTVLLKQDITIPIKKGENTILKGDVLSAGGDTGITLDPSFDGEFDMNF